MTATVRGAPAAGDHHLLTNGSYAVRISAVGAGGALLGPWALTRWTPDPVTDAQGWFLYVRDAELKRLWSAGHQPVLHSPEHYEFRHAGDRATILRRDDGIETRTDIRVDPDLPLEWRRYRFTNRSDRTRRLEVTSYVEVALNLPAADAGHPAFSKLFLETEHLPAPGALLARRRPRSPDDPTLFMAHALMPPPGEPHDGLDFETDRARFIGRGRTTASPAALAHETPLSGTAGPVLDPVLCIRRRLVLEPGETASLDGVLTAGTSREAVEQALAAAGADGAGDRIFAAEPEPTGPAWQLELPPPPRCVPARGTHASDGDEPLLFFNGHGGFAESGEEYVIRADRAAEGVRLPPMPWCNVVANPHTGFVASERGLGFTWHGNSRENRLTPWLNDPVSDPAGEALYVRDEEAGVYWSPTPGPVPGEGGYEIRHGFGCTTWRHHSRGLRQEVTAFVPRDEPVKIVRLRITNGDVTPRRLSVFFYAEWVLGSARLQHGRTVETEIAADDGAVLARSTCKPDFGVALAAGIGPAGATFHATADREAFLGRWGGLDRPAALGGQDSLDGRSGAGLDPVAAIQLTRIVHPAETAEWVFLLGQAPTRDAALELIRRHAAPDAVSGSLARVTDFWRETLSVVRVETPSRAIDLLVNGWLSYQNLSCRLWARSAFYQSGGAFGFRDQLQDAAALLYLSPAFTREQLLLHAAHQYVEGDVLHWWHPPHGRGIRTRFSDDLLWLPYVTLFYLESTGDAAVLDEPVRFVAGPALEPGVDEAAQEPQDSGERAGLFEHCCRALDRSLTRGRNGLPLMGSGDWNDGMNRVGHQGQGESVWLGFFLYDILGRFAPLCEARGDAGRAARYREHAASLADALNAAGWDGRWYRRAFYDDGTPLGSAESDEARIDAIAQAWAVLSRVAPTDRADAALDALEAHLVDESAGLIRLLTPPFDRTPHDAGYIKGYLPGVRENGGQYTHGALWAVRALAEAGRSERAVSLLEMLTPVLHADSPEAVACYQGEPYVVAADVYAVAPHIGRAGWTWYTGSAGWMYRVALESVLGMTLRGGAELVLRPCVPHAWRSFRITHRLPDGRTSYEIAVRRAAEATRVSGEDGARVEDGSVVIPLRSDGAVHRVTVDLGPDVGPRYRPAGGAS